MEALLFASFDTSLLCTLTGSLLDTSSNPSSAPWRFQANLWRRQGPITAAGLHLDLDRCWRPFRLWQGDCQSSPARKPPGTLALVLSASNVSLRVAFPAAAPRGRQRLGDKEPEAQEGEVTCLKIYFKPVASSPFLRNQAHKEEFKQAKATAASQPALVGRRRETTKGVLSKSWWC